MEETKKKSSKKNFIRRSKYNFKGEKFETIFHLGVSSKALFNLSEGALKLYMMFLLHGKRNPPSAQIFANRMKKSVRTISRLYEELKENGFLKIECVQPKVYRYTFDSNGNVNYVPKKEKLVLEKDLLIPKEEIEEQTQEFSQDDFNKEIVEEERNIIFDKVETIVEYEDFAVLENIYWTLEDKDRKMVVDILEQRSIDEPASREVIDWFLEKVKYV